MNRLDYIDKVKGFAICLVVLGHITQFDKNLTGLTIWIYSFHIPLFFIVSGYLNSYRSNEIELKEKIKRKWNSLIIPYIWFSIINFTLKLTVITITDNFSIDSLLYEIKRVLTLYGNGTVWFLACLFLTEIFFEIIKKYVKNKNVSISLISLLVIVCSMTVNIESMILTSIIRVVIATGFYMIGFYFLSYILSSIKDKYEILIGLLLIVLSSIICLIQGRRVDLYSLQLSNSFIYLLTSIIGSIGVVLIFKGSKLIYKTTILNVVGIQSLIIMLIHARIIDIVKVIFSRIGLSNINYIVYTSLIFIIVIVLSYIGSIVINKYFSFMIGKKKVTTEVLDV